MDKAISDAAETGSDEVFVGNVKDSVRNLLDPTIKRTMLRDITPEGKAAMKRRVAKWSELAASKNAELFGASNGKEGAVYSDAQGRFVSIGRKDAIVVAQTGIFPSRTTPEQDLNTSTLNELLRLIDDPNWGPLLPSRRELISIVVKANNEAKLRNEERAAKIKADREFDSQ